MTSLADHRIQQDVYHVPFEQTVLYVKFTTDAQGHLVIGESSRKISYKTARWPFQNQCTDVSNRWTDFPNR